MGRTFDNSKDENLRSGAISVAKQFPATMAIWARPSTTNPPVHLEYVATIDDDGANPNVYNIGVEAYSSTATSAWCMFIRSQVKGETRIASSTGSRVNGNWHHLCLVCADTHTYRLYVDGTLEAENSTSASASFSCQFSSVVAGGAWIGGRPSAFTWGGDLAWFTWWESALTAEEAAFLAKGAHPFLAQPDNIVEHWDLKGASGTDERGSVHSDYTFKLLSQYTDPAVTEGETAIASTVSPLLALNGPIVI